MQEKGIEPLSRRERNDAVREIINSYPAGIEYVSLLNEAGQKGVTFLDEAISYLEKRGEIVEENWFYKPAPHQPRSKGSLFSKS
jgi:hypothetical protein